MMDSECTHDDKCNQLMVKVVNLELLWIRAMKAEGLSYGLELWQINMVSKFKLTDMMEIITFGGGTGREDVRSS